MRRASHKFLLFFTSIANFLFCPSYESGAPNCGPQMYAGLPYFMAALNIGIIIFLFKTKRLAAMWGFLLAFVMNATMIFILGPPEQVQFLRYILMPFFWKFNSLEIL